MKEKSTTVFWEKANEHVRQKKKKKRNKNENWEFSQSVILEKSKNVEVVKTS